MPNENRGRKAGAVTPDEQKARRAAGASGRLRKKQGPDPDLNDARVEAKKIANGPRQKLMLDVIDALERCKNRAGRNREQLKSLRAREELVKANETRLVSDDEGRVWAISRDLPNNTTFVDGAGVVWRYDEAERHLSRINDGPRV